MSMALPRGVISFSFMTLAFLEFFMPLLTFPVYMYKSYFVTIRTNHRLSFADLLMEGNVTVLVSALDRRRWTAFENAVKTLFSVSASDTLRKHLRIRSVTSVNYHYITVLCPFNLLICFKCYNTV